MNVLLRFFAFARRRRPALALMMLCGLSSLTVTDACKPRKPVELVVHTGPGGGNDLLARAIAVMAEREGLLPGRVQVVNKPGGNGSVAMAYLMGKKGDPNAVGFFTTTMLTSILVSAEAKVSVRDLTPIARLVLEPALIVVRADAPYKTLEEFVEAAKKNPGRLKQSGGSITSRDNMMRLLLQKKASASWAFISFPGGGERVAALLGGHVDIMVLEPQEAGEHIRAATMRVLAQLSAKRLPAFPDVPTLAEAGFDVPLVPQMRGVVAPPGLAKEAVDGWEVFFRRLTRTETWKKYIDDNQLEDGYADSAELAQLLDTFTDRLREILKDAAVPTVR
jgi:putative tricarboxylic transport membrane protein